MFWLSMTFFLIAGVFYTLLFGLTWIAPPDDSPNLHRVILGVFALAFLSIGLYHLVQTRRWSGNRRRITSTFFPDQGRSSVSVSADQGTADRHSVSAAPDDHQRPA